MIKQKKKQWQFSNKGWHKSNVGQEGKCLCKTGGTVTKHKDDVGHIENQLIVSRGLE